MNRPVRSGRLQPAPRAKRAARSFPPRLTPRGRLKPATTNGGRRTFLGALAAGLFAGCGSRGEAVVVYCAADRLHAEPILRDFEAQAGVRVRAKYDTEATKSLSLVGSLIREAAAPACDLFWNNELLGTADLADRGLLAPHPGAGWEAATDRYRHPDGAWTAFGGRLRVWIVNTDSMPATREAVDAELENDAGMSFAAANPRYGTTLTHFSLLHRQLGDDGLRAFAGRIRGAGAVVASGNAGVKDLVAAGTVACGWTDTDDAFAARSAGAPVATLPILVGVDGEPRPVCIPNTVAVVKGGPDPAAAGRLADYLLSPEVAVRLANSPSRQVPLAPVDADLPDDVTEFAELAARAAPLGGLLPHRAAVLDWLGTDAG